MKKATRSEIETLLVDKWLGLYKGDENYHKAKSNVEKIVADLYDINEIVVYPLTERETFALRKLYGIFDDGQLQTLSAVAESMGCTKSGVASLRNEGLYRLRHYRAYNFAGEAVVDMKMSSADLVDDDSIKNIKVSSLGLSGYALGLLNKHRLFTINDLLTWSAQDLGMIIGEVSLGRIAGVIHGLGLRFIDELSAEEKRQIISKSSLDRVMASSISWIDIPSSMYAKLSYHNSSLGEVLELVKDGTVDYSLARRGIDVSMLAEQAAKVGFKFFEKDSNYDTIEEMLERPVSELGLSDRLLKKLSSQGYARLDDMTHDSTRELLRRCGMNIKNCEEIVDAFHGSGLLFADEVYTIRLYAGAIREQLGTNINADDFFVEQSDALMSPKGSENGPVKIKNARNG